MSPLRERLANLAAAHHEPWLARDAAGRAVVATVAAAVASAGARSASECAEAARSVAIGRPKDVVDPFVRAVVVPQPPGIDSQYS